MKCEIIDFVLVSRIITPFIPPKNAEQKDSCVLCSGVNPTVMDHFNLRIFKEFLTQ